MKTQGEIESAICTGIARFEQEFMGRGPKHVHAHLVGDVLVVRLQGVLTVAEQQLVRTVPPEKGRELLKEVRTQLIEAARPLLETLVLESTGVAATSLHHDISTVTVEEIVVFTLAEAPLVRDSRRKCIPDRCGPPDRNPVGSEPGESRSRKLVRSPALPQ